MPREKKDFLLNPVVVTIVIVIAVIASFNFYQNMKRMNKLEAEIEKIESQIASAEAENKKLKTQLENSDNYEYIEKVAREKLGLVKPGERLLIPIEAESEDEDEKSSNN